MGGASSPDPYEQENLPEKFYTAALARLFFVRARFFVPFF